MGNSNVYIDFHLNIEEGTPIFNVHATCSVYPEYSDEAIIIGEATLYLYDPTKSSHTDICGEADRISTSLSISLASLEKICDIEKIRGLIATCHFVKMKEEWRGKGLGKAFMKRIMEQLAFLNVELLLLLPINNFESDPNVKMKSFFSKLGFQNIEHNENDQVIYKYINNIPVVSVV